MLALVTLLLPTVLPLAEPEPTVRADSVQITEWKVPWEGSRPRDPYYSPDGKVWFVGQVGNYIAYLEPATGKFTRVEIEEGTHPHNLIVDREGVVWYAGNRNGTIGRYDPRTRQFQHYRMPDSTVRDPHTLVFDRNGDIFFTAQGSQAIGHLNVKTGRIRLVKVGAPDQRSNPYGIVVDAQNRAWANLFATNEIAMIDPATMAVKEYAVPRSDARTRRIGLTSDGSVWYVDYAKGMLGRFDPRTGKFAEWAAPGGEGSRPYAMIIDDRDRIWFFESAPRDANQLVGFDPRTERFFYTGTGFQNGAGTVRHAHFEPTTREIWFGTDAGTIGRVKLQ